MTRVLRAWLVAALVALALPAAANAAIIPQPVPGDQSAFVADGTVRAVKSAGPVTYIGGDFTHLMARAVGFARVSPASGRRFGSSPTTDGTVNVTVPDGAGGYYIGGEFTRVNRVLRNGIAHILPDGSLDTGFDADTDKNTPATIEVYAIAVSGSSVYVGGEFAEIGGLARSNIAKLSAVSGNAFSGWNPAADGPVFGLASDGSNVFAGGGFGNVGGAARANIAKLSGASGNAFSGFNPGTDDFVVRVVLAGGSLYITGGFEAVSGQAREGLAKLNPVSGGVFSWDPNADDPFVTALAVDGDAVYVGGTFSNIGGAPRARIAKLSATGAGDAVDGWNPGASDSGIGGAQVLSITFDSTGVYVGGIFETIAGVSRNNVAKLDKANGANLPDFDVNAADGRVNSLALSGGSLGVGGSFDTINTVSRNRIAALDANGAPTDWNPNANGSVHAIDVSADGSQVFAGGNFTEIGAEGPKCAKLCKLSAASGNAFSSFVPDAFTDTIRSIAVDGAALYAGGNFQGPASPNFLAKVSTSSGQTFQAFQPAADAQVNALEVDDTGVYAGGAFGMIGGQTRDRIAKLSKTTGNAFSAWNPDSSTDTLHAVSALELFGGALYVGGRFTSMGGLERRNLAKLSATSGNAFSGWRPSPNESVLSLAATSSAVYAGGNFTSIGGRNYPHLGKLSPTSGNTFFLFSPEPNNLVLALDTAGSKLHAGGSFTEVGLEPRRGYAEFSSP